MKIAKWELVIIKTGYTRHKKKQCCILNDNGYIDADRLHNLKIILLSSLLVALSLFYTQIYLVCLPSIARALSLSHSLTQLIFTINLLGFGISQLFYGICSDRYGQKKSILNGLLIGMIGSLASFFSFNMSTLCAGEFIAGFGIGACSVVPRALSKDLLPNTILIKAIASMSAASTFSMGVAPILGALLQQYFGWRSVFLFLLVLTVLMFILVSGVVPETVRKKSYPLSKHELIEAYSALFLNKSFIVYSILNSFAYTGMIFYLMFSPFLFQMLLHYSASKNSVFYFLFSASYLVGTFFVGSWAQVFKSNHIIFFGIVVMILGSVLTVTPLFLKQLTIIELIFSGMLIHLGGGLITPLTYKEILNIPQFLAGMSSGALNASRVLVAFIFSTLV